MHQYDRIGTAQRPCPADHTLQLPHHPLPRQPSHFSPPLCHVLPLPAGPPGPVCAQRRDHQGQGFGASRATVWAAESAHHVPPPPGQAAGSNQPIQVIDQNTAIKQALANAYLQTQRLQDVSQLLLSSQKVSSFVLIAILIHS